MGPRCTPTRRSTPIATMSGSRARSSKRLTRSTAPRTSGSATLVATSWRPSWPPAGGGGGGCARPSADCRTRAEINTDSPDFGHLGPMVDAARTELAAAGVTDKPEVVVADAGYWHPAQMDSIVSQGIAVLIPPDAGKRKGTRPGWDGGPHAFMRRVLATDPGKALYRKRQVTVEPVFAHTKLNRRIDRFHRRGRSACRSEWRLITATHNLLKLHHHTALVTA